LPAAIADGRPHRIQIIRFIYYFSELIGMEGVVEGDFNPYVLLPLKIGPLVVRQLAWGDFIELDYN